eukprot:m.266870 g.266870  ORF g.266870 m.266870 type:complete len:55 (-) comp16039_c0_seq12:2299-2463(-)
MCSGAVVMIENSCFLRTLSRLPTQGVLRMITANGWVNIPENAGAGAGREWDVWC